MGKLLETCIFILFLLFTIGSVIAHFILSEADIEKYSAVVNAFLSIGTSGVVAFIFYYFVSERLENKKRELVRQSVLRAYHEAKHNIAVAIIHASQKGGRTDLSADRETIEHILTVSGFREAFKNGRQSDEGFYAFINQMTKNTPEYDEIIFNLKIMGRIFERLLDAGYVQDSSSYDFFLRLDSLLRRIEQGEPGYDESKFLSRFIYQIFSGWNLVDGDLGYDPIEHFIKNC